MTQARPDVTLFFPVYRDERTVRRVTEKSLRVLKELAGEYEVVIVDDGSPDRSGEIADELAQEHASVRVVFDDAGPVKPASPVVHVGEAESRRPGVGQTLPIVAHFEDNFGADVEANLDGAGVGVPGHVGERLPESWDEMLLDPGRNQTDLPHNGDVWLKAQIVGGGRHDVADGGRQQASLGGTAEIEDDVAEPGDAPVEPLNRRLHAVDELGIVDPRQDRLKAQPAGENLLDDGVVQIPGDSLAVLENGKPLTG